MTRDTVLRVLNHFAGMGVLIMMLLGLLIGAGVLQ